MSVCSRSCSGKSVGMLLENEVKLRVWARSGMAPGGTCHKHPWKGCRTCTSSVWSELGLGVVTVGPWLARAARVRLVSDAIVAAVLTLRVRTARGTLARAARARALIGLHEVIEAQPEWIALHQPAGLVEVAQWYGETLLLEDAASRGKVHVILDVCRALGIQPRKLAPLLQRSIEYLRKALRAALEAGEDDPLVGQTGPHPYGVETIEYMAEELQRPLRRSGVAGCANANPARSLCADQARRSKE